MELKSPFFEWPRAFKICQGIAGLAAVVLSAAFFSILVTFFLVCKSQHDEEKDDLLQVEAGTTDGLGSSRQRSSRNDLSIKQSPASKQSTIRPCGFHCYPPSETSSSSSSSEDDSFVYRGGFTGTRNQDQQMRPKLCVKTTQVQPDPGEPHGKNVSRKASMNWTFPPSKLRYLQSKRPSSDARRSSSTDAEDDQKYPLLVLSISLLNESASEVSYNQIRENGGHLTSDYSTDDSSKRTGSNVPSSEANIKVQLHKCDNLKRTADGQRKLSESANPEDGHFLPDRVFARIFRLNDMQNPCLGRKSSTEEGFAFPMENRQRCIKETSHLNSRKSKSIKFGVNDFVYLTQNDFPLHVAVYEMGKEQVRISLGHCLVNFQPLFMSDGQTAVLSLRLYSTFIEALVNGHSDEAASSCRSSRSSSRS